MFMLSQTCVLCFLGESTHSSDRWNGCYSFPCGHTVAEIWQPGMNKWISKECTGAGNRHAFNGNSKFLPVAKFLNAILNCLLWKSCLKFCCQIKSCKGIVMCCVKLVLNLGLHSQSLKCVRFKVQNKMQVRCQEYDIVELSQKKVMYLIVNLLVN